MAGERFPIQPPAKRREKSSTTTVASLAEDVLLKIFLCLPSLAALIRAALTCRGWRRAVASSPAFRRRFRELHPAPLGFFFGIPRTIQDPTLPALPSFVPARRRDLDLTAAVRRGDFFLTSIQEHPDTTHCWDIVDCRCGYVLLLNGDQKTFAVSNPLAQRSERFFDFRHENILEGSRGFAVSHNACLICSAEEPMSFRVVVIAHDDSRVRATFFSSDTGEWSVRPWVNMPMSVRPWVDIPARPHEKLWIQNSNMQASGSLYWFYQNLRLMVTLDSATWEFSVDEVPQCLRDQRCSSVVGEMSNGAACIVYAINFKVGVLLHGVDTDGDKSWVLDRVVPLDTQLGQILGQLMYNYNELKVVAVRDGFAYLATSKKFGGAQMPSWLFSLRLETMKLELFQRTNDTHVHPYVMAWPPSLVGNHGRFALEDDTGNA